jgi:phospholipid N-methyltransferase
MKEPERVVAGRQAGVQQVPLILRERAARASRPTICLPDNAMFYRLAGHLHFIWAGLVNQRQTGGIIPSQRFLIAKMIAPVPETYRGWIVELGAGNGAITSRLAARCPAAQILACELNPVLARDNRRMIRRVGMEDRVKVITGSAHSFLARLNMSGMEKPGYVVSGVPLGNLDGETVRALMEQIWQTLAEGGMYIQFQHSLLDRKKIGERFSHLRTVPVWLNFPPAVVYYAQR